MARKAATNRRTTTAKSRILNALPTMNARGGTNLRSFINMPVTRYLAGGLALYGLVRLAMRVSSSYPQIGEFISENIDGVEGKFREWSGRESSEDLADARH